MGKTQIIGCITAALLATGVAYAQEVEVESKGTVRDNANKAGSAVKDAAEKTGDALKSAADKIQQGVKNVFNEPKLEELPEMVQKTIREQTGNEKINDIDREDRTGKTIYEVEFMSAGQNREIHVASDGTLLTEDQARTQLGYESDKSTDTDRTRVRERVELKHSDLPAAVQATAKQHGSMEQVQDIDTYRRNGKMVYEIEFRRDGPNREIHVSEDGTLMDVDQKGVSGRTKAGDKDASVEVEVNK